MYWSSGCPKVSITRVNLSSDVHHSFAALFNPKIPGNLATSSNPYSPSVTFLYPLKTLDNRRFSDVFRGYRNVKLGEYRLITVQT